MKISHNTQIATRLFIGTLMLMISLISVGQVSAAVISATDEESLMLMREEEKLARDVYSYLYGIYKIPIFYNISKSEQTHMNTILTLLNRYGIADPASPIVGEFNDPTLAALYETLIERGSISLVEALKVGVDIEVKDIEDLEAGIAATNLKDIKRVYSNLMNGSWNHYNAFVSNLVILGVDYKY
jgi:hypothetical protein